MTLRLSQTLLLLMGGLVTFGSVYFSITDAGNAGEWAIGAWALAMALCMLAAVPRLGDPEVRAMVRRLLALHLAFGAVKLLGYSESEAVPFMVVDAVLLGLLRR